MHTWLLAGSCDGGHATRRKCTAILPRASPPLCRARPRVSSPASTAPRVLWSTGVCDDDEGSVTKVDWPAGYALVNDGPHFAAQLAKAVA